ncbi:MAG TPA: ABC transporter substrate-binding protein, partial [Beutenbergiaceae bacterium]|nr:ABC transporter substrate-binding protein [Beutenbergiaceae bacterium]
SEDSYTLSANPQYWYDNHPVVPRVVYKATTSDDEVKELVADHELDWMEIFLPNYGEKFEKNGFTMLNTPMDVVAIYTCSDADLGCEGQQTHPAVREALHLAMDRELINDAVYNGYGGAVNLGLTPVPGELKWIGDKVADQEHENPDIEAAKQVLEDDGYRLNQSGVYEKDDQPLELELHTVADWSDYHTVATLVAEQANKVGIDLTLTTISPEEFAHMRNEGEFELMIGGISAPPTIDPYQVYSGWYGGQATEPVGTELGAGQWNFARYTNDDVDEAIRHATTTADRDEKLAAYATIQAAITEDLPYIPLITSPVQVFVNTTDFDGWPSQDNMYAYPSPVGGLSTGLILRAIEPVD